MDDKSPRDPTAAACASLAVKAIGADEAAIAVDVIAYAFADDPTWSWAFPDPAMRKRWWQFNIAGALRYPWVLRTSDFGAVSVWIPPDGTELSAEDEARVTDMLVELVASRAPDVAELLRRFEKAHPRFEPHYYLSLLGVANGHRGRGLGMALLKENLDRVDAAGMPAYLESSNPMNNWKYEALGFNPIVEFQAPRGGPVVTGMWRNRA